MSDTPLGEGWWMASDGKYYPPEQHPDYVPPAQPAPPPPPAQPSTPSSPVAPPSSWDASRPPAAGGPRPGPGSPSGTSPLLKFWWIPVLVGVIGIVALVIALSGGGDGDDVATADLTPTPAPTAEPTVEEAQTPLPEVTVEPSAVATGTPEDQPTPTPLPTGSPTPAPSPTATRTPLPAGGNLTPRGAAPFSAPAGFGQVIGTEDWRISVIEVLDADAEGLIPPFADEIPEGFSNMAIIYEITYVGPLYSDYDPVLMEAIGSESYEAYLGCFLDFDALAERGVQDFSFGELVPGQTSRLADCAVVPTNEIADIVIGVQYDFGEDSVYFSAAGGPLPELDPVPFEPGPPDVDPLPLGQEKVWPDWSAAIVDIYDANSAGLISDFAEPPMEGHVFLAVEYTVTNRADDGEFDPLNISALGAVVYPSYTGCFLDAERLVEAGLADPFDDVAVGATKRSAVCISLPEDAVGEVVFRVENFAEFEDPGFYAIG